MKSLAEYLGVQVEQPAAGAPAPEMTDIDLEHLSPREFARAVLGSFEYRRSLVLRVAVGDLPPQVECLLYHHAFGKPVERMEIENKTVDLTKMTKAELEQRARELLELARELPEDHVLVH